jgi:UDP-N-acetylglucosamine acyltransferase
MPIAQSARIHPTAVIGPEADLAEGCEVGAHAVIEGPVQLGPGCVLRPGARLFGPLRMGQGNIVFSNAVLGEAPQHLKYAGEPTRVEIGDHNVFREGVTIHRGTAATGVTCLGSHNFLMANSHVAHDCRLGDHCILANGALLAGHCTVGDHAYLSGNCAVHQFVRIGRLALLSGVSSTTMDMPPFIIQNRVNCIVGVNVVGMRRAGVSTAGIEAVRKAYHIIYRDELLLPQSLAQVEAELGHVAEVAEMLAFIRTSSRGINLTRMREAA